MKIAYFDCFSGISGDMVLGAFVDCGVSLPALKRELSKLNLKGFDLVSKKVRRGHICGTKVDVIVKKETKLSSLESIFSVINKSGFDGITKSKIIDVFENLAQAEAKAHRRSLRNVHFHQLGEMDTIVDITGCVCAMKLLRIEAVFSSPLTLGRGKVDFAGESLPLPAPATLELLKGRNVTIDASIKKETVTPTGAAILKTFTREKQGFPALRITACGYGAGIYTDLALPDFLRIIIGDVAAAPSGDTIKVIEANIDDMPPFNFEILFERLFAAGALDVYVAPINMKKMRPAVLLNIQAQEQNLENILELVFKETTTLGVRINDVTRRKIERKILNMKSDYGIIVKVKKGILDGKIVNIAPEYEDCKKIAIKNDLPFKEVYERVKAQALKGR